MNDFVRERLEIVERCLKRLPKNNNEKSVALPIVQEILAYNTEKAVVKVEEDEKELRTKGKRKKK